MKWFSVALIYLGFFGLIGFVVWLTHNPWVLIALIAMPSFKDDDTKDTKDTKGIYDPNKPGNVDLEKVVKVKD